MATLLLPSGDALAQLADRDEWRQQHENAIACWRRDNETLLVAADTARKAGKEWESLYNQRNRLWREAEDRLNAVRILLQQNGCDCDCEHGAEDHTDTCELCFPCRVSAAVSPDTP